MRIISVLTYKGGPGKTTLATNLLPGILQQIQRTGGREAKGLLIDCDLQGNAGSLLYTRGDATLTRVLKREIPLEEAIHDARGGLEALIQNYLGQAKNTPDIAETKRAELVEKAKMYMQMIELRQGFHLIPSDMQLYTAANYITSSGAGAYFVLRNALRKLNHFDYVVIDHAPSYNAVTEAALLASDELLIPCELTPYCVDGLVQMINHLQMVMAQAEHELRITAIVPIKVDQRFKKLNEKYFKDLENHFGDRLLWVERNGEQEPLTIRTDTTVTWAQASRQTVFEYDSTSKAARDFTELARVLATQKVEV